MEKLSFDTEHVGRVRALSRSKSSLRRSAQSSIPKSTTRSRVSPDCPDASRGKRVRFAGSASIHELEGIQVGHVLENEVDGAKTSEFKSFKRLLDRTAYNHSSDKVATSDLNLKKGVHGNHRDGFVSSPAQLSQKRAKETWTSLAPFSKLTTAARLFHLSPTIVGETGAGLSGLKHEHTGTFSGKRANLLQLAAGTCSQNVDDFLLSRFDFIHDILQRLGIMRNSDKHDKPKESEQDMKPHHFPASPQITDQAIKLLDNSPQNLRTPKPGFYDSLLTWDATKVHIFPHEHLLDPNFECELLKPMILNEKDAPPLPDFDNPHSTIDLINELDSSKYKYHDNTHSLLNSPWDLSEINVFQADLPAHTRNLYNNLHSEIYFTKNAADTWSSKAEIDPSNNSHLTRYYNSFQADCFLPNGSSSDIAEEHFTRPLLTWNATEEQAKNVDLFPSSPPDISGMHSVTGNMGFTEIYERRGFSSLQSCSFDTMLQNLTRRSKLDVNFYRTSTPAIPGSLLYLQKSPDGNDYSSIYSHLQLTKASQSGCENDDIYLTSGKDEDFKFFHRRLDWYGT